MLDELRLKLAGVDTGLLHLSIMGALCGLLAGGVIIGFRLLIEWGQGFFLAPGDFENYEALSPWLIFLLPLAGALLLGLAFQWLDASHRQVGVVHTMERLAYHQGRLPLINTLVQFFGAAVSIIAGHSVGREGPSVHLGAASGSLLGGWLSLPNNSIRSLIACGVAAAIAASFNTPLAGVIFAMEVILLEYSIAGFIPVILAAVVATGLSQLVFGADPGFIVPSLSLSSTAELPWVLMTGVVMGLLAVWFIRSLQFFAGVAVDWPVWSRMTLAGLITGGIALVTPQVMSIGYDTVSAALAGQLGFGLLLLLVFTKLLATAAGLGLGLPGGLIGPTLFIGAVAGGAMGLIGELVYPAETAGAGFYAMLGMGAMMGAALQAPLAALMAMMELTHNSNIILPGMLAIVAGSLIASEGFRMPSVFIAMLRARGLNYHISPVVQALRRVGVARVMDRAFIVLPQLCSEELALQGLTQQPRWVLVKGDDASSHCLPAIDLQSELEANPQSHYDLLDIPAMRQQALPLGLQSTLQEAHEMLVEHPEAVLYIRQSQSRGPDSIYGILGRENIEAHRVGMT